MATPPSANEGELAISLASIRAAAARIEGVAHRTPVLTSRLLDAVAAETQHESELRLFFKCENLQKIGAFKYRGALNAVKARLEAAGEDRQEPLTFVTHSSGNHGQALALAARDAGCRAVVVVPANAPEAKLRAVEGYGAVIERTGPTIQDREETAARVVAETGGVFVHPSNDPDVMSGQGTAALELYAQAQELGVKLDAILVPVGGGGLLSGMSMAAKSIDPNIKVFAVEPAGAADAHRSLKSGEMLGHEKPPQTIADGLRSVLGDKNWPVIQQNVDDVVLVSEDEIVAAMRLIWERMKLVVEPSGAVATAGALFHKLPADVRNVGVIFTGGNVDLDRLPWNTGAAN